MRLDQDHHQDSNPAAQSNGRDRGGDEARSSPDNEDDDSDGCEDDIQNPSAPKSLVVKLPLPSGAAAGRSPINGSTTTATTASTSTPGKNADRRLLELPQQYRNIMDQMATMPVERLETALAEFKRDAKRARRHISQMEDAMENAFKLRMIHEEQVQKLNEQYASKVKTIMDEV